MAEKLHKFINCRETAPKSATQDMYVDNQDNATYGGLAVGIPGEMKCMSVAHEKYGFLPWATLIQPIIEMLEEGIMLTDTTDTLSNRLGSISLLNIHICI